MEKLRLKRKSSASKTTYFVKCSDVSKTQMQPKVQGYAVTPISTRSLIYLAVKTS